MSVVASSRYICAFSAEAIEKSCRLSTLLLCLLPLPLLHLRPASNHPAPVPRRLGVQWPEALVGDNLEVVLGKDGAVEIRFPAVWRRVVGLFDKPVERRLEIALGTVHVLVHVDIV